jgi:hypothetical protein
MKRTLLAIGIPVLVSMMLVPHGADYYGGGYHIQRWKPFFVDVGPHRVVLWTPFILQTIFAAVAAAVIVNLWPRKK